MYKKFNLSSVKKNTAKNQIELKFNFEIDEKSITSDTISLVASNGSRIDFDTKVVDDLIILSLDIEIKQAITGFGIACLYNLPVPYGVSELFLSDYAKIDSTGDIYFEEGTPAGTKIRKTITYRYE